jgi:hypothetical protein
MDGCRCNIKFLKNLSTIGDLSHQIWVNTLVNRNKSKYHCTLVDIGIGKYADQIWEKNLGGREKVEILSRKRKTEER